MNKVATPPINKETFIKEASQILTRLGAKHGITTVFEDFLRMSATAISNAVDKIHFEEREKLYMEAIQKYSKEELEEFPKLLAGLVCAMEPYTEEPVDILGELFHGLDLHNKYNGQFFTPGHVCDLMGKLTLGEHDKIIEERGYITVCEPCAGSGAMIMGFAKAMAESHYDYQGQMVVIATDIDLKCVHMTYIQCALYGIQAVVQHGDTLQMKTWSEWYTPIYMVYENQRKIQKAGKELLDRIMGDVAKLDAGTETLQEIEAETVTEPSEQKPDITFQVDDKGQYSMFFGDNSAA